MAAGSLYVLANGYDAREQARQVRLANKTIMQAQNVAGLRDPQVWDASLDSQYHRQQSLDITAKKLAIKGPPVSQSTVGLPKPVQPAAVPADPRRLTDDMVLC